MKTLAGLALAAAWALMTPLAGAAEEIKEYQGRKLSAFDRAYDNSIRGPQQVDVETYRLEVTGLVGKNLSLTYDEVLKLKPVKRVAVLNCVEGWSEELLYEGVRLKDILDLAGTKPEATHAFFRAADGYSSGLPLDYLASSEALLAYKINGLALNAKRGFPFQLVAEGKLGYKWVKWIVGIELTDKPRPGFWEKRGYSDEADVGGRGSK